jgi:hypothetical protein
MRNRNGILVDGRARTGLPADGDFVWQPARIGPAFEWLDHDQIRILDGRLAGRALRLLTEVKAASASGRILYGGAEVGQIALERDPPGKGIVLWDVGVREHLRGFGLASILTWCLFRELLAAQETATFRIRMVRSLRAGEARSGVQNVGMCVIANRLGFVSDLDLESVLRPSNIVRLGVLPAEAGNPPALEVVLRTDPLVLVCLMIDPARGRPVLDANVYLRLVDREGVSPAMVRRGLVSIANGNFKLPAGGIDRFVNRVAIDEAEARHFRQTIKGL